MQNAADEMDLSIRRINSAEAAQSSRSGINIVTFGMEDSTAAQPRRNSSIIFT
jgi:hypothetical protein